MDKVPQNGHHKFDVLEHTNRVVGWLANAGAPLHLTLAALLHDTGKPATAAWVESTKSYSFHGHEEHSLVMASAFMDVFKFSNEMKDKVVHLVGNHMVPLQFTPEWSDAAIRRFIMRVGKENISDICLLAHADIFGTGFDRVDDHRLIDELKRRCNLELTKKPALHVSKMAINGSDLISIGFKQGERLGVVLKTLFEKVVDNPELDTKDQLLSLARAYL
jgi:poly(A) polymerase/tRNA nucleotidyltransferase (CCA-adding enzyme)